MQNPHRTMRLQVRHNVVPILALLLHSYFMSFVASTTNPTTSRKDNKFVDEFTARITTQTLFLKDDDDNPKTTTTAIAPITNDGNNNSKTVSEPEIKEDHHFATLKIPDGKSSKAISKFVTLEASKITDGDVLSTTTKDTIRKEIFATLNIPEETLHSEMILVTIKPETEVVNLPPPMPIFKISNIFTDVGDQDWSLEQKVLQVETSVCNSGCMRGFPGPTGKALSACQQCHCDATCKVYHTCCPDVVLSGQVEYTGLGSECVPLVPAIEIGSDITTFQDLQAEKFSSMITKCYASTYGQAPANVYIADETERFKCERLNVSRPDEGYPVSDTTTGLTYRNVYCARCNNVSEDSIYTWQSEVACKGNADRLIKPRPSKRQLYGMLTSVEEVTRTGCYMRFLPGEFYRKCRYEDPKIPVIKTCNETGLWTDFVYNTEVEEACYMPYDALFKGRYKNLFCYLCNTNFAYTVGTLRRDIKPGHESNTFRVSFAALVDFSDDTRNNGAERKSDKLVEECASDQFFDNSTCTCRDIKCSEGKFFSAADNSCQGIGVNNMIGYDACIRIEITVLEPKSMTDIEEFGNKFSLSLFWPSYKNSLTISEWCPLSKNITMHLRLMEIQGPSFGTLESLENKIKSYPENVCQRMDDETVFGKVVTCISRFVETCPEMSEASRPCGNNESLSVKQNYMMAWLIMKESDILMQTSFVKYLQTNPCPFVEIPMVDVEESKGLLRHRKSGQSISVLEVDYVTTNEKNIIGNSGISITNNNMNNTNKNNNNNNTMVRICLKDYMKLTMDNTCRCEHCEMVDDNSFDTWTTSGLVSMISSCLSLLFLFVTFITYALFPKLRSGGGKSMMVLTVILFIAQALYEFAIEQFENKTLCSVFGILIHFFWLATIFSMNACTWERFYKLCFPLKSRSFFMSQRPFVLATVYTFSLPSLIILCNITANLTIHDDIGYGNPRICYINERYSRIFSFVVPMCAIVILNTLLFAVTVLKLRRQKLAGNRKSSHTRVGLVACVRLSLVTGATWLISLLYEAVPVPAMSYVFTLLLGLQGVVFFFSVLGNKNTWELYSNLLSKKSGDLSSGSGSKTESRGGRKGNGKQVAFQNVMDSNSGTRSTPSAGHTSVTRLSSGDSEANATKVVKDDQ